MKRLLKHLLISFALVASSFLGVVPLATPVSASATGGECDDNAVVRCGIFSVSSLRTHYKGDVKAAYNYFGITNAMIDGSAGSIRNGSVTKSGDVILDGKVIATNAMTAGRQNMSGSTRFSAGGTTFYQRPPSVSFSRDALEAYIMVDQDGKFLGAILKPCGNPVKATPKVVKKPAAACTAVTVHQLTRTTYRFTGEATKKDGATISGYIFAVNGPGLARSYTVNTTSTTATTQTVTTTEPGAYTVTLTVKTSLGNRVDDVNCVASFTVEEIPVTPAPAKTVVCNPANGQTITVDEEQAANYKPVGDVACQPKVESAKVETIASTGPGQIIGGVAGIGSLTAAGYYLRASRQRLLGSIKR